MDLFKKVDDFKSDFTTYPLTFKGYKWYKPLITSVLAIILYLLFIFVSVMLLSTATDPHQLIYSSSPDFDITGAVTSLMIVLIIPSIYIPSRLLHERPFSSYLSLNGWGWSIFIKSAAIALLVFSIISIIQILIDGKQGESTFTPLLFLLCIIITPFQCFSEEFLCRGFLMQTFGSWFKIPILGIIIQAAIFTVLHEYNLLGLLTILITGLTFGLMTWYTKGLEVSSAIHTVNNIFAFSMTGFGFAAATTEITLADFLTSILMLAVSVILIIVADKKFNFFGFDTTHD